MITNRRVYSNRRRRTMSSKKFVGILFSIAAISIFVRIYVNNKVLSSLTKMVNKDGGAVTVVILGNSKEGTDANSTINEQREFIKQMMKDAWNAYATYAWGENELRPSSRGYASGVFGTTKLGLTIVDSVDTLYIMGLHDEYQQGRDWIAENLDFDSIGEEFSLFETNIRFLGGLLSNYALTGDSMYRDKAYKLAKRLLPAFNTNTGIPYSLISLNSTKVRNNVWTPDNSSILSEFGGLHLEFVYLSDITGDPIFREKVAKTRQVLKDIDKPDGLYSNYVDPQIGSFTENYVTMGAFGDVFYEYLLKSYIQTGDIEARKMYDDAMDAFEKNGLIMRSKGGLLFFAEMRYKQFETKMEHLACFSGGMFALGVKTAPKKVMNQSEVDERSNRQMKIAEGITNTCHESYIRTSTHLGPEKFRFSDEKEAETPLDDETSYSLRPEVVESYFVMWRVTGDAKYREWGWDAAQAIQKYCKVGAGGGYQGPTDVYTKYHGHDDLQQSFFLAETLKYLYLLFSSKSLMDLDYWVFNTQGHPLPIKAANPHYYRLRLPTRTHNGNSTVAM